MAQLFLTNLDLNGNQLQNVVIHVLAADPGSPSEGQLWFNSTDNVIKYYDGTDIVTVGAAGGGGDADTLDSHDSGYFLDRANHTGSQAISTITSLQTTLDAKAPLTSPALTGTPTAPTAAAGTNTTQIATTAFVAAATAALVDSAPGTLDTLNELAAALGDDANFATTLSGQIGALDTRIDTLEAQGVFTKYAADIGDGSTTAFVVTHNIGSRDVSVTVRQNASPWAVVIPDVEMTSTTTATIRFGSAPTTNQYRVIVQG